MSNRYLFPQYGDQGHKRTREFFNQSTRKEGFFNLVWECQCIWTNLTDRELALPKDKLAKKFADKLPQKLDQEYARFLTEAYSPNHIPKDHPIVVAYGISCMEFLITTDDAQIWNRLIRIVGHNYLAQTSLSIHGQGIFKASNLYHSKLISATRFLIDQFKQEPTSILHHMDPRQKEFFTPAVLNQENKRLSDCFKSDWKTEIQIPTANFTVIMEFLEKNMSELYFDSLDAFEHECVSRYFVSTANTTVDRLSKHILNAPSIEANNKWTNSFTLVSTAVTFRDAISKWSNKYRVSSKNEQPQIKRGIEEFIDNLVSKYDERDDFAFFGLHFLSYLVKNYGTRCGPIPPAEVLTDNISLFQDMVLIQRFGNELTVASDTVDSLLDIFPSENKIFVLIAACIVDAEFDLEKSLKEILILPNSGLFLLMANSENRISKNGNPHHMYISGNWGVMHVANKLMTAGNSFRVWIELWQKLNVQLAKLARDFYSPDYRHIVPKLAFMLDLGNTILCCSRIEEKGFEEFLNCFSVALNESYHHYRHANSAQITSLTSQALANLAFKLKDDHVAFRKLVSPFKRNTSFFRNWLNISVSTKDGMNFKMTEVTGAVFPEMESEAAALDDLAPNVFSTK